MKRRFFLFAAPAIVAAPSLMRVSTVPASLRRVEFERCWIVSSDDIDGGGLVVGDQITLHASSGWGSEWRVAAHTPGGLIELERV